MKAPQDVVASSAGSADPHSETLRVLIAEHPGGKLTPIALNLPASLPLEFETEDDLGVVATLAAQNAFDLVILGESLFGEEVDPSVVRSLADASHTPPILVLGETIPEFNGGIETGCLRVVTPYHLSSTLLLREIRQTLEMHVLQNQGACQRRRVVCLCEIFDHMLEHMPYAVAVVDEDGIICSLNQAARRFWNPPSHDPTGERLLSEPASGKVEILLLRPGETRVEVAPVPIDWLGHRYYLTSMRRQSL